MNSSNEASRNSPCIGTPDGRERRRETVLITAGACVIATVLMVSTSPTPLYPGWKAEMEFTSITLTLVFASYLVGVLLSLPAFGRLADRYGQRRVLLPGLLSAMVACIMLMIASSVAELVIARALTGIATGAVSTAGVAAVLDVGGATRVRDASVAASVAIVAGAGLGPLFAGVVGAITESPDVPVFGAELGLLVAALLIVVRLPLETVPRSGPGTTAWRFAALLPSVPRENLRDVLRGIAVYGPASATTALVLSIGPSIFADLLVARSALITGVVVCAMFGLAILVQLLSTGLSVRALFFVGSMATVSGLLALTAAAIAGSVSLQIIGALLAGAGQGWSQLGAVAMIGTRVRPGWRGEATAMLVVGGYVQVAILTVVAGHLVDIGGLNVGMSSFTATFGVAVLVTSGIVQRGLRPIREPNA